MLFQSQPDSQPLLYYYGGANAPGSSGVGSRIFPLTTPYSRSEAIPLDTPAFPGYKALCIKAMTGTSTAAQPRQSEPGTV
jgi:hypothetical protein